MNYRRVLIKLSGEALMGPSSHGFCTQTTRRIAREIVQLVRMGLSVSLVIGGGNIFRGSVGRSLGLSSSSSDMMGMLATVMNGIMFKDVLEQEGASATVFSSTFMPGLCEAYRQADALACAAQGQICVFVAGTGNPYFTTDTAAIIRGRDMGCDAVLKATKVSGVFAQDPSKNPHAEHYPVVSYDQVLTHHLQVMDRTALTLAQEGGMPILVFSILEEGALVRTLQGQGHFSIIQHSSESQETTH